MRIILGKIIALAWLLAAGTLAWAQQQPSLAELYAQIDRAIEESPNYVANYEARIRNVKIAFQRETSVEGQLTRLQMLYQMYHAFNNDSAIACLMQGIDLARESGNRRQLILYKTQLARQCSTVGMYTEAFEALSGIQSAGLDSAAQCEYYSAYVHLYGEQGVYTSIPSMRKRCFEQRDRYRDSLFAIISPTSEEYLQRKEGAMLAKQKYQEAMELNDQRMELVQPDSHEFAIVSYYRFLIYRALGDRGMAKFWLAKSALADIHNAVMDQASLIELANMLNDEGDFDRSYRYIRFTWDCNTRFNTRMRAWQIVPILSVIERNYQRELQRNSKVQMWAIASVSVLALLLLAALAYTLRERRRLAKAQADVLSANGQLRQLNTQLGAQAAELKEQAQQLATLNAQLAESNHVKEEYIGRFMSLCSQYINKLDDYRKLVNRKMKNKELDELFRISKSTDMKEKELAELYENFDTVFLHLFPTFIDEFNQLLQPEVQIHPKQEHELTTDLRIFALIRLGIEDSSKIAEFLHYSVNTIYNYRARTKNGALADREHFEQRVKEIGLPKA